MTLLKNHMQMASEILGVDICASRSEILYSYYRMITLHHPDKNPDNAWADSFAALINEAKDMLLGKDIRPTLLQDSRLVSEFMDCPVQEGEVLSYGEWLKTRFYDMENRSIWPC